MCNALAESWGPPVSKGPLFVGLSKEPSCTKLRCDRRRSTLRRGQITGDAVFVRGKDDHLVEQMVASSVELQRFSDGAVLLLNRTVVGHYVDRKAALLRIHLFQLQAHR